jgi:hypothetical protein
MNTNRTSVVIATGLVVLMTAGCELSPTLEPSPFIPTAEPMPDNPSPIPSATPGETSSPVHSQVPENVYFNDEYQFAFEIPDGWYLSTGPCLRISGSDRAECQQETCS